MTQVSFYHLERSSLEAALAQLLEKALSAGFRAVVKAASEERLESLNAALWTYDQGSFLPHGSAKDGHGPDQPIWLTVDEDNPAGAEVLFLTDGAESGAIGEYARCLEIFDGRDDAALEMARRHWVSYKEAGHDLTYWRQGERGGWEKQEL
ncbi:MAG: DNA polymerase III subunit chi [Alphaproteobacteria bacterium]|nr:DNA polymerase III subunit chi [Alphaproteobacteria bacterium]